MYLAWLNAYLNLLKKNPHLHDKLELEIVFTIWTPTFVEDAKKRFKNEHISKDDLKELENALKKITANAIIRLDEDISSIDILSKRFDVIVESNN